jgi:hypothetical protein
MTRASGFQCKECGSSALRPPERLSPDALLICAKCGGVVGTWSELQTAAWWMARGSNSRATGHYFPFGADVLPERVSIAGYRSTEPH